MLVNFMQNVTLLAEGVSATQLCTDPMPVSDPSLNQLLITLTTHRAFAVGTTPTFSLTVAVEGSNDGETWFTPETAIDVTVTTETNARASGAFGFAFVRIRADLLLTAGDWAAATIDLHGNLTSS